MKLKEEIRNLYKGFYLKNDKAHQIDHADNVCNLAIRLNNNVYDDKLVILASYLHDIFTFNRKEHHVLAYKYTLLQQEDVLKELSKDELLLVAHAVLEHRASYKGFYYSKLSEIISGADRGIPDIKNTVYRTGKYNNGDTVEMYSHIRDKFGSNGYAKYPKIYRETLEAELSDFNNEIDNLTLSKVEKIWNEVKSD